MSQHIYADNAATTKLDNEAFEAMIPWLTENYGNASQPYFFGKKAAMAVKSARLTIAKCINADPKDIIFTSGGTESDNMAVKCFGISKSDYRAVLTSEIEHHAILNSCRNDLNLSADYLSVDSNGLVNPDDIRKHFKGYSGPVCSCMTDLVSVMMANNEIGTIMPVKELAEVAHSCGARFHTDAVQAVGHIPIDVKALGIDMLSASGHKFNGPKGVGFLYAKGLNVCPHNDGGAQESGKRAGTENVAGIVGMAVALKNNCINMQNNMEHIKGLESHFMGLMQASGLDFLRNGAENHIPGNISLSFKNAEGEMLLHRLDLLGISVSTGSACDSVDTKVSHVIKAIKVPKAYAKGTIRISLGKYNTMEECEIIVDSLKKILG